MTEISADDPNTVFVMVVVIGALFIAGFTVMLARIYIPGALRGDLPAAPIFGYTLGLTGVVASVIQIVRKHDIPWTLGTASILTVGLSYSIIRAALRRRRGSAPRTVA